VAATRNQRLEETGEKMTKIFGLTDSQIKKLEDWVKTCPELPPQLAQSYELTGRFEYIFAPCKDYLQVTVRDKWRGDAARSSGVIASSFIDLTEKPEWA
jgi:hypothetical protein